MIRSSMGMTVQDRTVVLDRTYTVLYGTPPKGGMVIVRYVYRLSGVYRMYPILPSINSPYSPLKWYSMVLSSEYSAGTSYVEGASVLYRPIPLS